MVEIRIAFIILSQKTGREGKGREGRGREGKGRENPGDLQ
jgi:hypothetical protein